MAKFVTKPYKAAVGEPASPARTSRAKKLKMTHKRAVDSSDDRDELFQNHDGSESSGLFVSEAGGLESRAKAVKGKSAEREKGGRDGEGKGGKRKRGWGCRAAKGVVGRDVEEEDEEEEEEDEEEEEQEEEQEAEQEVEEDGDDENDEDDEDDDEDDLGRSESQQFLAIVRMGNQGKRAAETSHEYLENFKKMVAEEREGFKTFLDGKAAESEAKDAAFLEEYMGAYNSAKKKSELLAPFHPPHIKGDLGHRANKTLASVNPPGQADGESKHQHDGALLKAASKLEEGYARCEEVLKTLSDSILFGPRSAGDQVRRAIKTLEGGRLVGEKKIDGIMGTGGHVRAADKLGDDERRSAEGLFRSDLEACSWPDVAKKQARAVRKLTRTLPAEQ